MTREEAIQELRAQLKFLLNLLSHSSNQTEALNYAIAALEGKCEGCRKLKGAQGAVDRLMDDYRNYRSEAEEALKAMERERAQWRQFALAKDSQYWHDQFVEMESSLAARNYDCEQLQADLAQEREKVRANLQEMLEWLPTIGSIDVSAVFEKLHELFPGIWPDPPLSPEPQTWDWVLTQSPGFKMKYKTFQFGQWVEWDDDGCLLVCANDEQYIEPELFRLVFTEPGWLPYEPTN